MDEAVIGELNEMFHTACSVAGNDGLPLRFFWSNEERNNAWACYNPCMRRYEIHIAKQLALGIHDVIFKKGEFDAPLEKIREIYSIPDAEMGFMKKILFALIMNICYFHEHGHVINGHLGPLGLVPCISEDEMEAGGAQAGFTVRSLLEADADSFSALSLALIAHHTGINIPCEKDRLPAAAKHMVLLASVVLFSFFGQLAQGRESPDYPPLFWRLISIQTTFVDCYGALLGGKWTPGPIVNTCIDDEFLQKNYDPETVSIINSAFAWLNSRGHSVSDPFSPARLKTWYAYYLANREMLAGLHEAAQKARAEAKKR